MNNQCAAPSSMGNEPIFAELAATTNYSFLRGASHPSDMVGKAMELGYAGVGIADRNSVAGVVRAYVAVREAQEKAEKNIGQRFDFKLAVGARLVFADGTPEERRSQLQSLMRISYAVFCLKKKQQQHTKK